VLSGVLLGCSSTPTQPATNKDLTKQISGILKECYKIKVEWTRSELLKVFRSRWRAFKPDELSSITIVRTSRLILISNIQTPQKNSVVMKEQPTDIINHSSKPYMDGPITD